MYKYAYDMSSCLFDNADSSGVLVTAVPSSAKANVCTIALLLFYVLKKFDPNKICIFFPRSIVIKHFRI
jgi:hypothetical protein